MIALFCSTLKHFSCKYLVSLLWRSLFTWVWEEHSMQCRFGSDDQLNTCYTVTRVLISLLPCLNPMLWAALASQQRESCKLSLGYSFECMSAGGSDSNIWPQLLIFWLCIPLYICVFSPWGKLFSFICSEFPDSLLIFLFSFQFLPHTLLIHRFLSLLTTFFHNQCLILLPITGLPSPSLSYFSLHRSFWSDIQSLSISLLLFSLHTACSFLSYGVSTENKRRNLQPFTAQLTASAPHAGKLCFGLVTTPQSVPAFGFPVQIIWMSCLLLLQALACHVVQLKCLPLPHGWGNNTQHASHVGFD